MRIGLLIIGNEILEGKITDANTRQLSQFLRSINLELEMSLTVRDDLQAIHQSLDTLFTICDVVVTSGGLGPTKDDITKDALGSYFNRPLRFSEAAFQVANKNYERFQRVFPGKDHGYCFLPEGFVPLNNSTGFAPCFLTQEKNKFIISGPGVPWEFKSLLEDHFVEKIQNYFPQTTEVIESFVVKTKGIPEEKIFKEVDPSLWDKLSAFGTVSSLPNVMGVEISIKVIAKNSDEMEQQKKQLKSLFMSSPLLPNIWQFGSLSLEEYIVNLANKKNITYSFAESCTGGLCAHRVTAVSGSSQSFLGSVVSYAISAKEQILEVKPQTISTFGVVSEEVAREMSQGAAKKFGAHIAISITGVAGPMGGTKETPVGTACLGITHQGVTKSLKIQLFGDREQLKLRFSQAVLYGLLEELEKIA